ncbi:MAG: DNA alkylation repair protein [Ruminococcaceae bacterium]|nr:DNA alkylation repair protein [Oscillospiraceae bacterium]
MLPYGNEKRSNIMDITKELFKMQDLKYKEFHSKLMPTVDSQSVIGVRVPLIRAFSKKIKNEADEFLNSLPHKYYEENNLHAFLIAQTDDFDKCIKMLNVFLPFVDNWATCDSLRPKCFNKNKDKLLCEIEKWIKSKHVYTVRFAIEMLMVYYLDEDFDERYLKTVSEIKSEEYYINMMLAWYFATALAKKWDSTIIYLKNNALPLWVHNKTIQKAVESYRITAEQKEYLCSLKIKL